MDYLKRTRFAFFPVRLWTREGMWTVRTLKTIWLKPVTEVLTSNGYWVAYDKLNLQPIEPEKGGT